MTTSNTITHKNREYSIVEKMPISEFPNLARERKDIEFFFVAVGKRGASIDGYITKDNKFIIF